MYRNFLFILTLSIYSGPGILLDMFHSVSCCFIFAPPPFFSPPTECSKSPLFGKCLGKLIGVSSLSVLLLWNLAFRNIIVGLNQQSFLKHNGTQNHISICTNLWLQWVKMQPALAISHYRAKHWCEKEYNIKILVAADVSKCASLSRMSCKL